MYILIYGILYPLSLLPLFVMYGIGDFLYLLVYHLFGYRKKVVRRNLRNSFPDWNDKTLRHTEKLYYHHLCQLLVEGVKMLSMSRKNVMRRYRCTNPELLQEYATDCRQGSWWDLAANSLGVLIIWLVVWPQRKRISL